MEFRSPVFICISFCVIALWGSSSHGREMVTDEEYWHAVWPNTPIPAPLRELLKPAGTAEDVELIEDAPMRIDDTQYPKTYFYTYDLYPGKTMTIQFSKRPFAQPYGVYTWIRQIKDVDKEGYTFDEVCVKQPAAKGEDKFCAKSLGSLIGFVTSKLGKNIQPLSSSFIGKQEQYRVEGVQNLGDEAVMCHRLNFNRVTFYCHEIKETTAFMVSLLAADGTKTQALAVCHHDTSAMNHAMLTNILKADPGTKPVCHFMGNKALLWVPDLAIHNSYRTNNDVI